MKKMSLVSLLFVLFASAACSSLDIDGARLSAGVLRLDAEARAEIEGLGTFEARASDTAPVGRAEVFNRVSERTEVGLLGGYGSGRLDTTDFESYEAGAAFRHFLTEGAIRPYGELAVGYRRFQVDDDLLGSGGSDMVFGTASLGLELRLGPKVAAFAQAGWDVAAGEDFRTDGPVGFFGLSFDLTGPRPYGIIPAP